MNQFTLHSKLFNIKVRIEMRANSNGVQKWDISTVYWIVFHRQKCKSTIDCATRSS